MDRLLRREFDAIARDRRSGAAELALRAVTALQSWLRRHPRPTEDDLLEIARALLRAQSWMAPFLRLANEVARAVDARNPADSLVAAIAGFARVLRIAPERIAQNFVKALPRHRSWMFTYSYSSTVVRALTHAKSRIRIVYCSESRPGYEGRTTATKLARAGIRVCLSTDATLISNPLLHNLVLGADKILPYGFENKIGSQVLAERVRRFRHGRKAVWVLADTTKFWPESWERSRFWKYNPGPAAQVWKDAPRKVWVKNNYFDFTRFFPGVRICTERGWMTPEQVRRQMKRIRISPRLKALAD